MVNDLHNFITKVKEDNQKNLEDRISYDTMANIRAKLHQESPLSAFIDKLDRRVSAVEQNVRVILKYSFEVYNNYLRIFDACFHIVCILYIVDNLVSNGIAED